MSKGFEIFCEIGHKLENLLNLRSIPVAFKFLESKGEIPQNAFRPWENKKFHISQCQAFSLSRRNRLTIAMLKEDHWCWAPLVWYGLVQFPKNLVSEGLPFYPHLVPDKEAASELLSRQVPLPEGKYVGLLSAPLTDTCFVPDGVLIYCNSGQLRTLLMAYTYLERSLLTVNLFPFNSCIFSVLPVVINKAYTVTLPDPGEFQRALAGEDEIIFSVPGCKLENLLIALEYIESIDHGYKKFSYEMRPDFPRPSFYDELFGLWGLAKGASEASCGGIDWR